MTTDRSIRVSVLSEDAGWLLRLAEVLADLDPLTYQSTASAVAEMVNGDAGVVVVGPADAEAFMAQRELAEGTSIILVVEEATVELLQRAMGAGVNDVVEVTHLADLPAAVRAQHERIKRLIATTTEDAATREGGVVVVTSTKAGQGSTTVAANLAVVLAGRGTTALVEGDPLYGDVLAAFGYRQGRTALVAADAEMPEHWLGRFLYRHPSGLLLAIPRPDTSPENLRAEHALDALAVLQHQVDVVILDIPLWALERYRLHRAADEVLFVSTDRTRDLAHVRTAVQEMGHDEAHTHLVISNYLGGRTADRVAIQSLTGLRTIGRIPDTHHAEAALSKGEPLVSMRHSRHVTGAFEKLADSVARILAGR